MSRKHYIETARILSEQRVAHAPIPEAQHAIDSVAMDLASMFKADNTRFDRSCFLRAAGVKGF